MLMGPNNIICKSPRAEKYYTTSGPTNATMRPNAPVNNNGNGAERGFEWEHYRFEDPHNPEP